MLQSISERLTISLIESSVIDKEDEDLYQYGILQGFRIILNIFTALIIGLIFGKLAEIAVFMLAYIPLRSYAGGFHAKTPLRCYIFSVVMLCVISIGLQKVFFSDMVLYIISVVSAVGVFILSPIEDKNKPLDGAEIRVFKKRARIILAAELLLCAVFGFFSISSLFTVMVYELACMSIMLVLGMFKNLRGSSQSEEVMTEVRKM